MRVADGAHGSVVRLTLGAGLLIAKPMAVELYEEEHAINSGKACVDRVIR